MNDDKSQEKLEKEKIIEEKIIKEVGVGEKLENDDFNVLLDIFFFFMKEIENFMYDKLDENEKWEDESLKENIVKLSDFIEINDDEKKDDKFLLDD